VKCPACQEPLIVIEREGIEVDWCAACGGIWFDAGELELLAEAAGRDFVLAFRQTSPGRAGASRPRRCPRCAKRLEPRALAQEPPTELDLCPRGHGIWLDRGELGATLRGMQTAAGAPDAGCVAEFLGETFDAPVKRQPSPDPKARRETGNGKR